MKQLISLCLSFLLVLSLAACGDKTDSSSSGSGSGSTSSPSDSSQEPEETLPFSLALYPTDSLHPVLSETRANLTLGTLLYEPLFQLDASLQPVPVLCQEYTASPDNLSWTFTLRSGVTFSDGTALSGSAVAETLNLARQAGSRYAQRLRDVTSVTSGGSTVTITLSRPNGNLPALLDIPIALGSGSRPLGTGPYRLSGEGDSLSLTARTDWWKATALPTQEILLTAISQGEDLVSAFASGGTGLVDVDLMGTDTLGYSGNYEPWDYPTTTLLFLGFNTQRGICQESGVRQALAQAINRDAIVQGDYARHAVAATLPVHPANPLYDSELAKVLAYDSRKAAAALQELQATGRAVTLIVNTENSAKAAAAKRIAEQLEAVGIPVRLSRHSFEDYTAALAAGNYDLYLGEVVLTADFNLTSLLSASGALNYGNRNDWQIDGYLSAMTAASGQERITACQNLFTYLNQQVPIAPIAFKNGSVLTQWGRLSGLSPVRGNVFHQLENWTIK